MSKLLRKLAEDAIKDTLKDEPDCNEAPYFQYAIPPKEFDSLVGKVLKMPPDAATGNKSVKVPCVLTLDFNRKDCIVRLG